MPSEYVPYSGLQYDWPIQPGSVAKKARSAPVYRRLPEKPYTILGAVHLYGTDNEADSVRAAGRVATRRGGDAGVLITSDSELIAPLREGSEEFYKSLTYMLNYDAGKVHIDPVVLVVKWK